MNQQNTRLQAKKHYDRERFMQFEIDSAYVTITSTKLAIKAALEILENPYDTDLEKAIRLLKQAIGE